MQKDGPFGKALSGSGSGSIGRARSSSQQREYRQYHTSTKTHGDGSLLVGMPASADDADAHQAPPPSVSDVNTAHSSAFVCCLTLSIFSSCREQKLGAAEE